MKAGDKARLLRGIRLESQRFRVLSIVVGCFLISLTFLVSSRPEATVFTSLSREGSKDEVRKLMSRQTMARATPSSSGGSGEDFQVDIVPQPEESLPKRLAEESRSEWPNEQAVVANEKADSDESSAAQDVDEEVAARRDEAQNVAPPIIPDHATIITEQEEKKKAIELVTEAPKKEERTEEKQRQPADQLCDLSDFRTDICDMHGDIRMDANASTFVLVDPAGTGKAPTYKVRPYPRKGDETCMRRVTELTVRTSGTGEGAPQCTTSHAAPGVVFSIGGYTGNIFHDFSDVLVPLFHTVRRYGGDVQLVMADVAPWWLVKYDRLLRALSRHPPLDLGKEGSGGVHCFGHVVLSLRAHKELVIERERSADGLATPDFTGFVRGALSLPRDAPTRRGDPAGKKPRLLVISRRRTRLLLNVGDIARVARDVGFDVVVNESDVANDIADVGRLVNSCDAMLGVHGAGLTNMVFLPPNATMIQVVPWGGLQWIARMDYGEPAMAMGLKYVEYDIGIEESSLVEKYPRDHEIFTNPFAFHKRGFLFMKETLMDGQNITIDVNRFKSVLLQALDNLVQ